MSQDDKRLARNRRAWAVCCAVQAVVYFASAAFEIYAAEYGVAVVFSILGTLLALGTLWIRQCSKSPQYLRTNG